MTLTERYSNDNKIRNYDRIYDPGHSWLEVPIKDVRDSGIYNILHDFTCGHDAVAKNKIGCNADPSLKATYKDGQVTRYAGYPLGCTSDATSNGYADQD